MDLRALALVVLLPGCATYFPKDIDETVKLVKDAGGSGCLYVRGNSRPYADVSILSVSTYGQGTNYKDCIESVPEAARAIMSPDQ